jgi:hypothetical protein
MSYHAHKAKEILDDAKQYLNPQKDAVMCDLINGLSELCLSISDLHAEVDRIKQAVQYLQR